MSRLDVDTRSDIISLGLLLCELLTGATPLDAWELKRAGLDEVRRLIREKDPVPPSTRLTQLRQQRRAQSPVANRQERVAPANSETRHRASGIRNRASRTRNRHRSGLDRDEVPREGPDAAVRDGQQVRSGPPTLPRRRTGRGPASLGGQSFSEGVSAPRGRLHSTARPDCGRGSLRIRPHSSDGAWRTSGSDRSWRPRPTVPSPQ